MNGAGLECIRENKRQREADRDSTDLAAVETSSNQKT